jgi:pectate lyase
LPWRGDPHHRSRAHPRRRLERLIFENGDQGEGDDAIHVTDGTRNVWIDHCSLSGWGDGLVDIARGDRHHRVVVPVLGTRRGHVDRREPARERRSRRVTLHHNLFLGTEERHPRLRFGEVHAYNHALLRWGSNGMASTTTHGGRGSA